jgi:hypothetical protein
MARLTAAIRNALPDSAFAGPNRTYPVDTKKRAIVALKAKIDAKADKVLHKRKHNTTLMLGRSKAI